MFGVLDWLVLVFYWGLSIFIGLYAARNNRSFKDYMLGGGTMPWIPVGISLIATSVSATTLLGVPADVFDVDMTLIMTNVGSFLSILVIGLLFIPRLRNSGIQSAYELLERSFSRTVRRVAAVFYAMHLVLRTGILLFAPSLVLAPILQIPVWAAILISSVAAILYTWHGGFKAVVWTDVMQFLVFFGGGVIALLILVQGIGGFGELALLAGETGKSNWFNGSLDPSNARTLLSAGIVYAVLEIAIRGCDQQFVQRYLSCKDVKAANRSSILSMVLGLAVSLLFYWLGAALFVYYRVKNASPLPENLGVNDVFPYFIVNVLPSGLTGLLVAAIYAAAMSSISSAIHALGNTTEKDILCKTAEQESMSRAKLWIVLWGVCGTFAAFIAASQAGSLLKNALFFTGLFTGPLLALFLLSFFTPYLRSFSVLAGVACGMLSLLLFNGIPFIPGYVPPLDGVFSWPWNPLISCTVSVWLDLSVDFVVPRKVVNEVA
ncbi:MAG: sodium/solute symporter [Candidatus Fibromonas sp.]|jgi:SSS family solute:Na+ symporter|nr:sodium/solute symporter [Candidatus Fibromonas sp.]